MHLQTILKGCEHDGSFIPVSEVKRLMEEYSQEVSKDCFPREFVEWLIHNTMEATTYSPLVYLKFQSKEEIGNHGGQFFDFYKEWHIDELFEYWKTEIKDKP
jgi:hypothetical protein